MRVPDWEARLAEWIAREADLPFCEEDRHCGWFVADGVAVMTACDLVAEWRGRYKTITWATKGLQRAGFADHVALVASLLPEVPPAFAHRGDVMVIDEGGRMALGLLQGEFIYMRGAEGIVLVNRMMALRAFRVI